MAGNEDVVRVIAPFEVWKNGSFTLTGLVENIVTKDIPIREVILKAVSTNTGNIEVGASNLTSSNSALTLKPNETASIKINNLKNIFILGTSSDQLNYIYVK